MLEQILKQKEKEVVALHERYGSDLRARAEAYVFSTDESSKAGALTAGPSERTEGRSLKRALKSVAEGSDIPALIAEIKRKSPSKGVLREAFDPLKIALDYETAHVQAISVLTDVPFFAGDPAFVSLVKRVTRVPVLRKDFIIDSIQLYESVLIGADAVLLIVRALNEEQLFTLYTEARRLHLDVLVEVHDLPELKRALLLPDAVIGMNNRNLNTFETTLETTYELLPHVPKDRLIVSESGIRTHEEMRMLKQRGVHGVLVGETLMRASDLVQAVYKLRHGHSTGAHGAAIST